MSDEDFLSRWSRRKRAAAESMAPSVDAAHTAAVPPSSSDVSAAPNEAGDATETSENEEFDLASLPPIDSIVEGTDISGFLKRGVPLDLTRAALRRAWSTDPAIRDFIGLAESAWDFNDPNAMPGFGPLDRSPEEVRQMLAKVMGELRRDTEEAIPSDDGVPGTEASVAATDTGRAKGPMLEDPVVNNNADPQSVPVDMIPAQPQADVATQQERSATSVDIADRSVLRRVHGGALPR
ncbi:MAG: DUF3306 domain-containing protein [Variibacter sp.]